jgi:hypothetical protein
MNYLIVLFVILELLDIFSTAFNISRFGVGIEANPIASYLGFRIVGFIFKVASIVWVVFWFTCLEMKGNEKVKKYSRIVVLILDIVLIAVVFNNFLCFFFSSP